MADQHFPRDRLSMPEATGAPKSRWLFRRRKACPFIHLHPCDQMIAAVLGTEDRGFAFFHLEPVLAERIQDVRLVGDDDGVGAGLWWSTDYFSKGLGAPVV